MREREREEGRGKYLLQIGSFGYCVTEQIPTGPNMSAYVIYSHSVHHWQKLVNCGTFELYFVQHVHNTEALDGACL